MGDEKEPSLNFFSKWISNQIVNNINILDVPYTSAWTMNKEIIIILRYGFTGIWAYSGEVTFIY